jgi:hypothetical protein
MFVVDGEDLELERTKEEMGALPLDLSGHRVRRAAEKPRYVNTNLAHQMSPLHRRTGRIQPLQPSANTSQRAKTPHCVFRNTLCKLYVSQDRPPTAPLVAL